MAEKSINVVNLLGRLGRDAETKFTGSGVAVTNFSIATTRAWKQGEEVKEETDWHNCVLWRAEKLATFLTKGSRLHVTGRLQTRSYDDKDGNKRYATEVVVSDVVLLGEGKGGNAAPSAPRPSAPPAAADTSTPFDDDEVPF